MRALTVLQPWAWHIIHGSKRIENRTWPAPRNFRGPLLIHAGKSVAWLRRLGLDPHDPRWVYGAVLGTVDVVDCVTWYDLSPGDGPHQNANGFAVGPWCWLLANPRALAEPIPCKGALGLFEASIGFDLPATLNDPVASDSRDGYALG